MKIAVVNPTTFPATLSDDLKARHGYGSESQTCYTVKGLLEKGHDVHFFAPVHSSQLGKFHPLTNTKGQIPHSELLEDISALKQAEKTTDLLQYDFIIDNTKQNHIIEDLRLYHRYNRYCCWKSGFNDYVYPIRLEQSERHLVTHCKYFADYFKEKGGVDTDVVYPVIDSDFWTPLEPAGELLKINEKYVEWRQWNKLATKNYFLFPHRLHPHKGIEYILRLAKDFPNEIFVVSTSTPLPDHKLNMQQFRQMAAPFPNIKIVESPENKEYHYYRRQLMRDAKCILSPFSSKFGVADQPYLDTGGIVSLEALACGTPVIVTRSPGSEEFFNSMENNGVIFMDGYDSLKCSVQHVDFLQCEPKLDSKFGMEKHIESYENIMRKYS